MARILKIKVDGTISQKRAASGAFPGRPGYDFDGVFRLILLPRSPARDGVTRLFLQAVRWDVDHLIDDKHLLAG